MVAKSCCLRASCSVTLPSMSSSAVDSTRCGDKLSTENGPHTRMRLLSSYGWSNSEFPLADNWVFGASVNLPIFSGGLTAARVAESRANLRALRADERTLRQQIALEVRRALLDVARFSESIDVSARAAEQAQENLELAQGRYEMGVGNVIELTDAQVQRASAEAERVGALYDHQIAIAALEQAIGQELSAP